MSRFQGQLFKPLELGFETMEPEHFTGTLWSSPMPQQFTLQASNPQPVLQFDSDDASIADAIQTIFPLNTERAFLNWNYVYVPLSYKYDLSLMIDDVIGLIETIAGNARGTTSIHWPSNTFAATWTLAWNDEHLTIDAEWRSVSGNVEQLLSARPHIVLRTGEFLAEWKRPLDIILKALSAAGYNEGLRGMARLRRVVEVIPGSGLLYA